MATFTGYQLCCRLRVFCRDPGVFYGMSITQPIGCSLPKIQVTNIQECGSTKGNGRGFSAEQDQAEVT